MIESFLDSKVTQLWVPGGSLDQDIVKTHTKMPTGDGYKVKAAVPGFYPIFSCLGSPSVQSMLFSKSSFKEPVKFGNTYLRHRIKIKKSTKMATGFWL